MQIQRRTFYALLSLRELSIPAGNLAMTVPDLARRLGIPSSFLQVIFVELRRRGLVEARRGRRGGYRLAKAPSRVTVGEVVRALQGPVRVAPAGWGHGTSDSGETPFAPLWGSVEAAVEAVYDQTTLADLREAQLSGARAAEPFMDWVI